MLQEQNTALQDEIVDLKAKLEQATSDAEACRAKKNDALKVVNDLHEVIAENTTGDLEQLCASVLEILE